MALGKSPSEVVEEDQSGLLAAAPHWERVRLGDVASVLNGFPFDSARFVAGRGTPLARIRDVLRGSTETCFDGEFEDRYLVRRGDLLVGMDGDFNIARWRSGPALLNQRVCKVEVRHPAYASGLLDHMLPVYLAAINAHTSSVTVKHLSSRTVEDIPLPLPPLGEQSRLVEHLDELFSDLADATEELRQAQRKLTLYRQSLLKSAVEGALTAEWRGSHPLQTVGRRLADGCPGALPASWTWLRVDQLPDVSMANGRSVPTADSGAKVLRLTAVRDGRIELSQFKRGAWSDEDAAPFAVREGDLLIVRGNGSLALVGRAGAVPEVHEQVAYPDTLIRLRASADVVRTGWLAAVWDSPMVRNHLERRARTSAGIYKISQPDIASAAIPIPPLAEQEAALALLDIAAEDARRAAHAVDAALKMAAAQRQNILRAAFSGQLVPQDPNDEPASVLLARIRAAREAQAATSAAVRKPRKPRAAA